MRINKNQYDCCGCTACESICPKQAITMQPDNLGFLYPQIDDSKCIDCGLCIKICNFSDNYKINKANNYPLIFAVRSKDIEELHKSQSGAAFFEFAKIFIQNGGIVYGAALTSDFSVKHIKVETFDELDRLRMSKYTQSQLTNIFHQVKTDLQQGKKVLFSGTPCQISGLNGFLPDKLKSQLTTIDIICHGVPSPSVWKEYIKYTEHKYGVTVSNCLFRDKAFGWASHFETFIFSNGKTMSTRIFRDLFYSHLMLRYSCYVCPFTNLNRVGDITVGDFWGWTNNNVQFNDNLGVSLVFVNTEKGERLYKVTIPNIQYIQTNEKECLQPQLQYPSHKHPQREQFEKDFIQRGFEHVAKKYGVIGIRFAMKQFKDNVKTVFNKIKWHLNILLNEKNRHYNVS